MGGSDSELYPEVVLLFNTQLWGWRTEIESFFGGKVEIFDGREQLLRDVCRELELVGLDGNRTDGY